MDFTRNDPKDLIALALLIYRSGGDPMQAEHLAQSSRVNDRVRNVLKAASLAGDVSTWGSALDDLQTLTDSFLSALRNSSVFSKFYSEGFALKVPMNRRTGTVITGAAGAAAGAASVKAVSAMSLSINEPHEALCAALVVVSNELLKVNGSAESILNRELRAGMTAALDTEFLAWLGNQASTVVTATSSPRETIKAAIAALTRLHAGSKLALILPPAVVGNLAMYGEATGSDARAFPDVGVNGGTIGDVVVIPSDVIADGSPSDTSTESNGILVDVSQLILSADVIHLATSEHGSVEMDDSPTGGADKVQVSLWHRNLTSLRAEQKIAYAIGRPGVVVQVSDINW